ncbi:MFS transporter [Streptomyces spiroverticillatus]|uniref:MFS transporter n=1 Tax=Streptomyces finlayi TaxID=67296 RepID=A0A918WYB0_9ACTN|nr:MFS transporter [Streptomyces finlayi]GHA11559.1 MFS transporter [Streptomyces spiroverticillatus]GHC94952.1 MFS transporter [Streptomyces finlayi]
MTTDSASDTETRRQAAEAEESDPRLRTAKRLLVALFGLGSFGAGAFTSAQVLFFTQSLHRTPGQISVALSTAGAVAMVFILPFGKLADRLDRRRLVALLNLAAGIAFLGYLLPSSLVGFVVVTGAVVILQRMVAPVRSALIAQLFPVTRVKVRAATYVAYNAGFSLGSLGAAWAVSVGTEGAYRVLLFVDVAGFLACAAITLLLPVVRAGHDRTVKRGYAALRDRPFLVATATNLFGSLHDSALFIGVPLWLLQATDAPHWTIPTVTVVNCLLVVALQTRLTRGTDTRRGAALAQWRGTLALGTGCVLLVFTAGELGVLGYALLACAVVLFTVSEMVQSAGAWGLSFSLADESRVTEYQAVFGLSLDAQEIVGPLLVTGLVLGVPHGWGWALLGLFVVVPSFVGTRLTLGTPVPWRRAPAPRTARSGT